MSTSTGLRRRRAQIVACAGVGAVATLVGTASPAFAADGVMVRLEPTQVILAAVPIENFGGDLGDLEDPSFDPSMGPGLVRVPVQYGGTITVTVPAGLDASGVGAELVFDDNEDGTPEATYSSRFAPANPKRLVVSASAGSVTVTLPTDDPIAADAALLTLGPVTSTLGPAFEDVYDGIDYELGFDAAAPAAQTVAPVLAATSQIPCDFTSYDSCPLPTPVTPGSTVTLALTQDSVLRQLGLGNLSGVQVALLPMDEDGITSSTDASVPVDVAGSRASFVVPEDSVPGSYSLYVAQETPSGGISTVFAELTVEAPAAAPVAEPAAPKPNPGLRSNTGVHLPEAEGGSNGPVVAAGMGLLLMAGAGAAVARGRRRPVVEGGPCEV
jgi:hypothetical protein